MSALGNSANWHSDERRRVNDEIVVYKKKHEELARRIKQVEELLNNRGNQLNVMKKRCEETRLALTELESNERRIAAIHELEKLRYSKIQQAVTDHKASISRATKKNVCSSVDPSSNGSILNILASPDQSSYTRCSGECQLDEKEKRLSVMERSLLKREQELVIRRNHNAARVVRLRKLLHSHEAKRALCKEQLSALKAKANRRY
ncbi:uncharacterized protein LOC129727514 [Wyeomyia smithii]|uniref:uncharacterized protein LOC129727514 n=1 Tax=Wyeomyia smithii TaxID=174621 RepID=UPI002467D45B|nr:uncharacterized protein LOC129727514 [Wyeomyia smithii]